jgi:hypothetical protein
MGNDMLDASNQNNDKTFTQRNAEIQAARPNVPV